MVIISENLFGHSINHLIEAINQTIFIIRSRQQCGDQQQSAALRHKCVSIDADSSVGTGEDYLRSKGYFKGGAQDSRTFTRLQDEGYMGTHKQKHLDITLIQYCISFISLGLASQLCPSFPGS